MRFLRQWIPALIANRHVSFSTRWSSQGMKILKTNLSRFPHPSSLILLTWYLISISYILLSPVHFLCLDHAVILILYLHTLLRGILFIIIFLVYSIYLFLFNPSFCTLFIEFLFKISDFYFHFYLLNSLLIQLDIKKPRK